MSRLLERNCTLEVLNVSGNTIGDEGISVIVEQLQHITTLTTLCVRQCGLSAKGDNSMNACNGVNLLYS